jgi:hypothetical protein
MASYATPARSAKRSASLSDKLSGLFLGRKTADADPYPVAPPGRLRPDARRRGQDHPGRQEGAGGPGRARRRRGRRPADQPPHARPGHRRRHHRLELLGQQAGALKRRFEPFPPRRVSRSPIHGEPPWPIPTKTTSSSSTAWSRPPSTAPTAMPKPPRTPTAPATRTCSQQARPGAPLGRLGAAGRGPPPGRRAKDDGTILAAAHRAFVNLKDSLTKGDEAVVNEVESGEDFIKAKFEKALQDTDVDPRPAPPSKRPGPRSSPATTRCATSSTC